MDEQQQRSGDAWVGAGYAYAQLTKAFVASLTDGDPQARERAEGRLRRWEQVLSGIVTGRLTVGSRRPVRDWPVWVTPEVVHGGFATGNAKHSVQEMRRTPLGSLVVCGDRQLLLEEAPGAYKRIEQVVGDLTGHALATPIATTVPLVTYKTPDRGTGR